MMKHIDPLDKLSGKVVVRENGLILRFKEPGNNMNGGFPIWDNLHSTTHPAIQCSENIYIQYFIDGVEYPEEEWAKYPDGKSWKSIIEDKRAKSRVAK